MTWRSLFLCALALPAVAAADPQSKQRGSIVQLRSRSEMHQMLRAGGYKARGGIDKSQTSKDDDDRSRSFPHFTQSFNFGGANYPYTMVGYPPRSGRSVSLESLVVPVRVHFLFFAPDEIVFEPDAAVTSIVNSPLYRRAQFANGYGQFGDQLQRAAFWNQMDRRHSWHVEMDRPRIAKTLDVYITPETGSVFQFGSALLGNILIDAMDAIINTYIQAAGIDPDVVPIFVTDNVIAEALGYHSATQFTGSGVLQTYIYASWLDPALVDPIIADISTINHELSEWMNDPYVNNVVPLWMYPPSDDPRTICGDNPFLEVGDPQGNGPTFDDFPTVVVPLDGVDYHLQQIVLLQWFTGEVPSSAYGGWYTFPDPTSITQPFVPCP
ncbi:MAG TPA: hypothetical protein VMH40_01240 [Myxococcaceae bacterium]|nr:hypothetical protein [Myxococcaceae bacterium]